MSSPLRKGAPLLLMLLAASPVAAQETCGKIYEGQDCGMADLEAAAERMRDAAARIEAEQEKPTAPAASPPADPAGNPDLRQRALDLYRARAAVMAEAMRCCHPTADGGMWCH